MRRLLTRLPVFGVITVACAYILWLFGLSEWSLSGFLISLGSAALFCYALWDMKPALSADAALHSPQRVKTPPSLLWALLGWVLLINCLFFAWALIISPGASINDALARIWYNTIDANNYAEIAEYWYYPQAWSDLQYKIVFFPLYPILLRVARLFTGGYPLAGMVVSSLCAFFGGVLLYKLAHREYGEGVAKNAVKYLFILPSAFFFMVPMTESLFLLLTVAFFYCLLSGKYARAGLLGFLAALTRSQGLLLAAPFALELLHLSVSDKGFAKKALRNAVFILAPLAGTGVYLLINQSVYQNPFQFMDYQRFHWDNNLSFFWNTATYLSSYFFRYLSNGNLQKALGLSLPNILSLWLCLGFFAVTSRKTRPSITIYALAYAAMSFGTTWLLSGPRYMACLFPAALAAARLASGSKRANTVVTIFYLVFFVIYLYIFVSWRYVY